ncbi:MAG: fused MFS/spermidine synthase [Myxococcales bacterium]|nr:fused MFS/spermidine synthase [Myxococcales bacterium]
MWLLFFVSGATSLVYQTVWARELHLVVGTSSSAISTVLAAFMAGLGIGGALAARVADRVARPLRAYGILEVGIGLYALAFPSLVSGLAMPLYLWVHRAFEPGPLVFGAVQACLVGVLLLPPTAAMGATLPLLARLAVERLGSAGKRIGQLYAINTAGAVVGTALAGLVLLPVWGLLATTLITAAGNLLLGAVAWVIDSGPAAAQPTDDLDRELIGGAVQPDVAALVVIGLGGAASLACEVAWTRLVGLVLGGTTYAFTAMLVAVLIGIAAGGRFGGAVADTALRRGGTAGVLRALAAAEVAIALLCWGITFLWPELPYWFVWLYDALAGSSWDLAAYAAAFVVCVLVLLPPAFAMGMAFPLAVRAAAGDRAAMGRPVALAYATNTLGGVVGAASAGFVLLPWLTVRGTVGVAAAANLVAAAIALWRGQRRPWAVAWLVAAMGVAVIRAPWDPLWMTGGMHHYVTHFDSRTREGIHWWVTAGQELLFYEEGLSTVVTVGRTTRTGTRWLTNNGKVDASSKGDMPTQILCALLPAQFTDAPQEGLVIGLASGVTAGAAAQAPGVGHLEVVELEPAILRAARFFEPENFGVLDDPRVTLVANDGRNHVLRSRPGQYDWIVSEPSNPYISGVSNLFTREFWDVGRTRLAPGGVWSQWVQLYAMGPEDLLSLLRTFAHAYPHVAVYAGLERDDGPQVDMVLVGSEEPLAPTFERAEALFTDLDAVEALAVAGVLEPAELVAMHAMDRDALLSFVGEGPQVTDDNMRVEYSAPLYLHQDTQVVNWEAIREAAVVPWAHLPDDPERLEALAQAYAEHGSEARSQEVLVRLAELLTD